MREALRRILWLAPMLIVVTLLAFWTVSESLEVGAESRTLPLFFNTNPPHIELIAWADAVAIAEATPPPSEATSRLARIGGAALTHILPRLDSLSPLGRKRVALALAPIAYRMGSARQADFVDGDAALLFWTRFHAERFVDFRPSVVKRAVQRYVKRVTELRTRELRELDTFALDELIKQMNSPLAQGNPDVLARLSEAAAHVTNLPWRVPRGATRDEAAAVSSRWQAWWAYSRIEYVTTQGIERLLSPLLQTRYALWAREAARTRFGILKNGQPAVSALLERAPTTLWLFAVGLLGGTLIGVTLGTAASVSSSRTVRLLESASSVAWISIPAAVLAAFTAPEDPSARALLASVMMLLIGGALVARYQRSAARQIMNSDWVRTYRALGVARYRLALATLRISSSISIATMAPHTSTLLTSVFVIEFAFSLNGIGQHTISALHQRDVIWLMLVTLATASLVGLVQIFSDLFLKKLDPRRTRLEQAIMADVPG